MASAAVSGAGGGFPPCRSYEEGRTFKQTLRTHSGLGLIPPEDIVHILNSFQLSSAVRFYKPNPKDKPKDKRNSTPLTECAIIIGLHATNCLTAKCVPETPASYPTYEATSFFHEVPLHHKVAGYRAFSSCEDVPFVLHRMIAEFLHHLLRTNIYDTYHIDHLIELLNRVITTAETRLDESIHNAIWPSDKKLKIPDYMKKIGPDGLPFLTKFLDNLLVSDQITEIQGISSNNGGEHMACLNPHRICSIDLHGDGYHPDTRGDAQPEFHHVVLNILIKIKVVLSDSLVCIIPLQFDRNTFKKQSTLSGTIDIFSSEIVEHLLMNPTFMTETVPNLLGSSGVITSGDKILYEKKGLHSLLNDIITSLKTNRYTVVSCDMGCKSMEGFVVGKACNMFDKSVSSIGFTDGIGRKGITIYNDKSEAIKYIIYSPDKRLPVATRTLERIEDMFKEDKGSQFKSISAFRGSPAPSVSPSPSNAAGDATVTVQRFQPVEVFAPPPLSPSEEESEEESEAECTIASAIGSIIEQNVIVPNNVKRPSLLQILLDQLRSITSRCVLAVGSMAGLGSRGGRLRMARSLRKKPSFSKKKRGRSFGRMKTSSRRIRHCRRRTRRRRIQKN
jgi:hypothetical protein